MSPLVETFRFFARRYSIAVRRQERAAVSGTVAERDCALDHVRGIEREVEQHLSLTSLPADLARKRGRP
jgi:hypothetical protein